MCKKTVRISKNDIRTDVACDISKRMSVHRGIFAFLDVARKRQHSYNGYTPGGVTRPRSVTLAQTA